MPMPRTAMITIVGNSIEVGKVPFNIFTLDVKSSYVLFCRAGYEITPDRQKILGEHSRTFYVQSDELVEYLDYATERINKIVRHPEIKSNEKTMIVKAVGDRLIHRILEDPKSGKTYKQTDNFVNSYITLLWNIPEVKNDIFSVAAHGRYLFSHSFNVCTLCLLLGEIIYGKDQDRLHVLGLGGLLHDLGMTKIARAISDKPSRLSAVEMEVVRRHPEYSREMLITSGHDFAEPVIQMAYSHHERVDGSGYPDGRKADAIHPYARIAAVADTYDAITSDKPYKKMEDHIAALEEMAREPEKYDQKVFDALLKIVLIDDRLVREFRNKQKLKMSK